jgi:hypothetical protein
MGRAPGGTGLGSQDRCCIDAFRWWQWWPVRGSGRVARWEMHTMAPSEFSESDLKPEYLNLLVLC